MPQTPGIGQDVTALMPKVGEDVTALMSGAEPHPAASAAPQPRVDLTQLRPSQWTSSGATPAEIGAEIKRRETERVKSGASILPTVAGTIGAVMGGVPGAALGGVVGRAVAQSALRDQDDPSVPPTAMGQIKDLAKEGAIQGALEGTGQALVKGAGGAATWLMNRATTRISTKLARDFPDLSQTLIDHAISVSKGGEGKARALLVQAKGAAKAALSRAESEGATVPLQMTPQVAESFKTALIEQAVKAGKTRGVPSGEVLTMASERLDPELRALMGQIDDAAKNGASVALSPTQADVLKTQLQKESRALYANRAAPNGPAAQSQDATLRAELAARLNDAIDGLAAGYKSANKDAQQMIGALRGVQQARRPSGNLYQAMVRPLVGATLGAGAGQYNGGTAGAIAGGAIGAAAMSPAGMSKTAIGLAHPGLQMILRQLPRASQALLIELLGGNTPPPATPGAPQ